MIHVIHTPTGWKVCQNYPESRVIRCYGKPDCCEGRRCDYLAHRETIKASIANAVDVREEDQEWVKRKVFFRGNYFPLPDMEESEQELKDWKPNDNQVYALPELEMRIKEHCQHKGIHNSACIYSKLAHVFCKKEEPKMEESQEELLDELTSLLVVPIVKYGKNEIGDKEYDEAMDDIMSKFHLTRVKAELKGEKK